MFTLARGRILCLLGAVAFSSGPGCGAEDSVLTLVDLCRRVCACFGVGNDSALAEISGTEWAMEKGDLQQARRYFEAAEALVSKLDATYDQARFLEARAALKLADPEGDGDPQRDLRAAEALFVQVGDQGSVARVQRALASTGRGEAAASWTVDRARRGR